MRSQVLHKTGISKLWIAALVVFALALTGMALPGQAQAAEKPAVKYKTHVQKQGWQGWTNEGKTAGTTGQSLRLEGLKIDLDEGSVEYKTHVQTYGWEGSWKKDGATSGTTGESKRLEAVQIRLKGAAAEKYDIYYRVHAQTFGWMGWAKNGEKAGTAGYANRLEGIQVKVVEKGAGAPGSTSGAYKSISQADIYKTYFNRAFKNDSKAKYKLVDIDGNGIKEMLVVGRSGEYVYTINKKTNRVVKLEDEDDAGSKARIYYNTSRNTVAFYSVDEGDTSIEVYKISGTSCKKVADFEIEKERYGTYYEYNDRRVSKTTYNNQLAKYTTNVYAL